jgi:hypothetical protein
MDPKLRALARSAAEGKPCPVVNLLLPSGALLIGRPTRPEDFEETSKRGVEQHAWEALHMKGMRKRKEEEKLELYRESMKPLTEVFKAIQVVDKEGEMALTLENAQWLPPAGDGLKLPVIRVPVEAVVGWWFGGGERISGGGSWSFFFGGVVPIDN